MYPELQALIHEAEFQYLQAEDLGQLSDHVSSLQDRLATYKIIRDQEIEMFQTVADKLLEIFPQQNPQQIETAIKHWLLVIRYCAMAMLLNNPEFLERRLLEWFTDIVKAHEVENIENSLYSILQAQLLENLSETQIDCLQPFLEQARNALINTEAMMA